ncbi:MAG: energy transducer TonB [Acidobacteriota bacterium]|nr:energy transducer TonB [Acidobacteriota bacterium]
MAQTQQTEQTLQEARILSKPRAIYTDSARKKGISGTVRLRVVFLASGEIGDITFVSETSKKGKLTKYGLVEQAIEAAKKIKFTPQIKNGKPITVTKLIEYNFLLY